MTQVIRHDNICGVWRNEESLNEHEYLLRQRKNKKSYLSMRVESMSLGHWHCWQELIEKKIQGEALSEIEEELRIYSLRIKEKWDSLNQSCTLFL